MQHRKIDITPAILSNIDEDTAKEFIDHRLNLKKPLTQGAFQRNINQAIKCEAQLGITASEAFEIAIDKGWQGVTLEYIQNDIARRQRASQEAIATAAVTHNSGPRLIHDNTRPRLTRDIPLHEELNDRSWAN